MAVQRCSFATAQERAEPVQKGTQEALLASSSTSGSPLAFVFDVM
jgi:hypothetical protein